MTGVAAKRLDAILAQVFGTSFTGAAISFLSGTGVVSFAGVMVGSGDFGFSASVSTGAAFSVFSQRVGDPLVCGADSDVSISSLAATSNSSFTWSSSA